LSSHGLITAPQEGRRGGGAAAAAPWPADRSCGRRYETGGQQEGLCTPEQGQAGGPLLAGARGSKARIGSRSYGGNLVISHSFSVNLNKE